MKDGGPKFLDDFTNSTEADWRLAVETSVSVEFFRKTSFSEFEEILTKSLYRRAFFASRAPGRPIGARWAVVQRVDHPDPEVANQFALADLEGGADSLDLVFSASGHARGYGIGGAAEADLARLTKGILFDLVTLRIDAGEASAEVAGRILKVARRVFLTPRRLVIAHDPLAALVATGHSDEPIDAHHARAAALAEVAPNAILATADGRVAHAGGASDVQELAAVLASAVAAWRGLEAAGIATAEAARRIGFTLAVDHRQFRTIAKIRALRLMWWRLQEVAGLEPAPASIHAETAWRALSRLDPRVNTLRATIAAFAAGVGGADSITVLPFTAAVGLPDAFARRLARNTQTVLLEEANLHRIADPAGGSGLVEAETQALAAHAWALFQEIEAAGGLLAMLRSGEWQARIGKTAAAREQAIARRKLPLTGIGEFPNLAEVLPATLDVPIRFALAPLAPAERVVAMPPRRLAEPFEALRDASDAHLAATGRRPRVFLANLGPLAAFNARSSWVKNLLEAGGIEAVTNDGFDCLEGLVAGFRASGTPAACLCGSDEAYAREAASAAAALAAAGARDIMLAGKPADEATAAGCKAAGIGRYLHAGMDVIAALGDLQRALGLR